jgi:hypothetical protein
LTITHICSIEDKSELKVGEKPLHARKNLFTPGKTLSRGDVVARIDEASRNGTPWSVGDVARYMAVEFFRHKPTRSAWTKSCEGEPTL